MNVMQHPFMPDLSDQTLEQLQEKIATLTKNLNWAYRVQNSAMIHQLHMIIGGYQTAYAKKLDEQLNKQNANDKIKVDQ